MARIVTGMEVLFVWADMTTFTIGAINEVLARGSLIGHKTRNVLRL